MTSSLMQHVLETGHCTNFNDTRILAVEENKV